MLLKIEDVITNKSGFYFKGNNLLESNPDLFFLIENHCKKMNNLTVREMVYLYYNKINEQPICKTCSNPTHIKNSFNKGFSKYCTVACMNRNYDRKENIKNQFLKIHNVESHNQLESIKKQKIKTLQSNFGVDNPMQSDVVKNKFKKLLVNKYGVSNPMHISNVINNKKKNIIALSEKNIKRTLSRIPNNYLVIEKKYLDNWVIAHNDHNFEINSNLLCSRLGLEKEICTVCNPINSKSSIHLEISEFLKSIDVSFSENNRVQIKPLEIDFYLSEYNLGIELNGLFWHSDVYKNDNYHLNKTIIANNKNIKLLHIFEDEWINNKLIIMSMIKNKVGLIKNKIYARKCYIKEITSKESNNFLEKNHLQGSINSSIKLGLFNNDQLVSVMTFGKKRKVLGSISKIDSFELYRFCNKLDLIVVGGASKLLKFFIKNYNPKEILTYANKRYSNGDIYEKLNFSYISDTKPNYWYVRGNKRLHRYNFRKDILIKSGYNKNDTEKNIMKENGYLRIYDCGSMKFTMNL